MPDSLKSFNDQRSSEKRKSPKEENLLQRVNESLKDLEVYQPMEVKDPLLFVVGLPRSGTTFCTQLLHQGLDLGYINNFVARFWLAPVTGIQLSHHLGIPSSSDGLNSDYATTSGLNGVHEFGYFWRHWLKKETVDDFRLYEEAETQIDWPGLKNSLDNIQDSTGKPMVMKNNFGGFHMDKILEVLERSYFIYIQRDPVDVAMSIWNARKQFFEDDCTWWATITPNYNSIKDLDPLPQIAEQVKALNSLYGDQIKSNRFSERKMTINYEDLSEEPNSVLKSIEERVKNVSGVSLNRKNIDLSTKTRSYEKESSEKTIFEKLLKN